MGFSSGSLVGLVSSDLSCCCRELSRELFLTAVTPEGGMEGGGRDGEREGGRERGREGGREGGGRERGREGV